MRWTARRKFEGEKQFLNEILWLGSERKEEWMKVDFFQLNRQKNTEKHKKLLKNMSRKKECWLIPISDPHFFRLLDMQTNNNKKVYQREFFLVFVWFFDFLKTHLFANERVRAIDINLISKLLFKSKQMYFIVRNYWQYVLRDVRKEQCDNNGRLLSSEGSTWLARVVKGQQNKSWQ